ncbi:MAG: LysR family transcriptional regulator [Clostridiales bacterium]|nr:LysR family transcriptional regulator [Clostridiales bacterium]
MKLCDIQAFLAVAEHLTISKAAEELFVSQSTASHRIQNLEDELGVALIERQKGRRRVALTKNGFDFLPIARQWTGLWKLTREFGQLSQQPEIIISAPDSVNAFLLRDFFKSAAARFPDMRLRVNTLPSSEIYAAVHAGTADIGFVFSQRSYQDIICRPLFSEKIRFICQTEDFGQLSSVHPSELDTQNEIFLPWSDEYQNWHDTWWNPELLPRISIDNATLLMSCLSAPRIWAACPETVARFVSPDSDLKILDFSVPPPSRTCNVIQSRTQQANKGPAIERFLLNLDDYLQAAGFRP